MQSGNKPMLRGPEGYLPIVPRKSPKAIPARGFEGLSDLGKGVRMNSCFVGDPEGRTRQG